MANYAEMAQGSYQPSSNMPEGYEEPNVREGADAFRQRTLEVHQQLLDLERQYGNANIIPKHVAHQIIRLAQQRDHMFNQWQEMDSRSLADTDTSQHALQGFGNNSAYSRMMKSQQPAYAPNQTIQDKMRSRAQGVQSMSPTPSPMAQAMTPGMNPAPAPAQKVQGKVFGDAPDGPMPGGTTPQFGHAPQKPWQPKRNPGIY